MSESSAKEIIKKLPDYKYYFFDENVKDSCSVDNPIVIIPPTDAKMSLLKVYAFGGCIGYVSVFDKGCKTDIHDNGFVMTRDIREIMV